MKSYSLADGTRLVKAARQAIELRIISPRFSREMIEPEIGQFSEEQGVFVTIEHYPTKELRGCIGFPMPSGKLKDLLIDAAVAAATEDPRFVPVSHYEFEHMVVEVSLLTKPDLIHANGEARIKKEIKVGRDGLMIRSGYNSGLLLPIVAVEQKWGPEEFLENLCIKAGLPKYTWKHSNVELYKFGSQVFRETAPYGEIEEVKLK